MNLLIAENITKSYVDKILLNQVNLGTNEKDKIRLIGINGTGKSTFLKILAGIEPFDEGRVIIGNNVRVDYLSQNPDFKMDLTVLDFD